MEDETGVTVVYRGEERIRDMSQGQKRPVSSKNRATEFVKLLKKKKNTNLHFKIIDNFDFYYLHFDQ